MDEAELNALVQQLGQVMSDVSESCYYAGWLIGTEFMVPELCRRAIETGRTQYWGHSEVTPEQATEIVALAERIGGWANMDDFCDGYNLFHPFPIPQEYIRSIEEEQSSGYAQRSQQK